MAIPPELDGPVVVDVLTAAKVLKLSRNAVYAAVREGSIPSLRMGGRILIPVAPLLRVLGIDEEVPAEHAGATAA